MKAILFDLDGTFLDTAPDLARALNQLLTQHHRPNLSLENIRPYVSLGTSSMVEMGFAMKRSDPRFEGLRQELIVLYANTIAGDTHIFPGIEEVLLVLESKQIPWGIVTNKPMHLTEQLFKALALPYKTSCIICGDTLDQCKPHPAPVLYACQQLGVQPTETLFIGDALQDIQAGKAAGTRTLLAQYGYLHTKDAAHTWGADGIIAHPLEILTWLNAVS